MALTGKQRRFVAEYLIDLNATQAAIRAGYSPKRAEVTGSETVRNRKVAAAIADAMKTREKRTEVTQDMVLQRLWLIASANVNELVQYRRLCCRYCYGKDHKYQWTEGQYQERAQKARDDKTEMPDSAGGFGFDPTLTPVKSCPECFGEGHGRIHVKDTRDIKGAALALYAGVKQGKEGLEVKMTDQLGALEKVGQHLGMFSKKLEVSGPKGAPVQTVSMTPDEFRDIAKGIADEV